MMSTVHWHVSELTSTVSSTPQLAVARDEYSDELPSLHDVMMVQAAIYAPDWHMAFGVVSLQHSGSHSDDSHREGNHVATRTTLCPRTVLGDTEPMNLYNETSLCM